MNNSQSPKIPKLATGQVVPESVLMAELKQAEENKYRKMQYRHDWLIAIFGVFGGAIAGFLTSLLFWFIGG